MAGAPPYPAAPAGGALCVPHPSRVVLLPQFLLIPHGGLPRGPHFLMVGYVEVTTYNIESRKLEPHALWMGRVSESDPWYWEGNMENVRGAEVTLRAGVQDEMGRHNHTTGLHMVQWMYGCELRDDGSIGGFWHIAYDGRDFVSFDKENMKFTAASITVDTWNNEGFEAQTQGLPGAHVH